MFKAHDRNANLFLSLEKKDKGGQATFGDNGKGNNPFGLRKDISCDDDVIGDLDELNLKDPQPSGDQHQLKKDPSKALGDDDVELQE